MRLLVKERYGERSANHSSRWNTKRPTERQTRRVDIDGEAEDDEVAYQFRFVKWCKQKATTQVGVVDGAGTSSAAAAETGYIHVHQFKLHYILARCPCVARNMKILWEKRKNEGRPYLQMRRGVRVLQGMGVDELL
ncbi:hypothetical protein ACQJBY_058374 [Aegilops geniculata]